jgi:nitrate reductase NapAB chaperone NapD
LFQFGVSNAICSLVVQRKVGTTLRRSATFHWKVSSTAVMTKKPSTTAIQSSVRQAREVEAGAETGWVRA